MDIPAPLWPIVSTTLAACLAGAGFVGKRAIAAADAITATQQQIATHLIEDRATSTTRHNEVMGALGRIVEAMGLAERVKKIEGALIRAGALPPSPSAGSRGSRPDRG